MVKRTHDLPWLVLGDFNQVISSNEKFGGNGVIWTAFNLMTNCMKNCNLFDFGASGPKYTWWNKRVGSSFTKVRLDRAIANEARSDNYPSAKVLNVPRTHSHHHPVLVRCKNIALNEQKINTFRFERAWMAHPEFVDFIKENWSFNEHNIFTSLNIIAKALKRWCYESFGDIYKQKRRLLARLKRNSKEIRF